MKRMGFVTVLTIMVVVFAGCAGGKKMNAPSGAKMTVPEWYVNPPKDDDRMISATTATSKDLQTAVDKAKQDARAEIARQLDLRMTGLSKRFVEETGLGEDAELLDMFTQVSKSVISDSLVGSRVAKQQLDQEGAIYRAYVMMEMPIGEANARLIGKIKAQERLYTRFRASQTYDELDEEVKKYEEWKANQVPGSE
jgi:hypothetical protein